MTPVQEELHDIRREHRGNYYIAKKELMAEFGLTEAVFFDVLLDWKELVCKSNEPNAFFFIESKQCEKLTGLTYKQQYRIYTLFEKAGLIKSEVKGIPPKKWISIDWQVYREIIIKHRKIK